MKAVKLMHKRSRRTESPDFWRDMVTRWDGSGQSQAAFCRQENIKPTTFNNWRARFRQTTSLEPAPANKRAPASEARSKQSKNQNKPSFVSVEITDTSGPRNLDSQSQQLAGNTVPVNQLLAAELVDEVTHHRLRIFNGADSLMVSAIVAAMTTR